MYFDTSLRKYTSMALLAVMMTFAVSLTFELKNYFFGSTPFFPAAVLFVNRALDEGTYAVADGGRQLASVIASTDGSATTVANVRGARAIPVLTYHRITDWGGSTGGSGEEADAANVSLPMFRDQMEALYKNGWRTVSLNEFEAFMDGQLTLPEKSFVLTFDDGAKDSFYPVDPILKQLGYTAVNYLIVTGMQREETTYYLTESEVKRMLETGRWEIGSHTYDAHHTVPIDGEGNVGRPIANKLWKAEEGRLETTEEFRQRLTGEFAGSKRYFEKTFGIPINTFAFPFGDTGTHSQNFPGAEDVVLSEAAKHYHLAFVQKDRTQFSYNYTYNYPKSGFVVLRIGVEPDWSGRELLDQLERGMPKDLPYSDSLDEDRGWVPAWGKVAVGDGALKLTAQWPATSASTILDGSRVWADYRVDATVDWERGHAFVLTGAQDARTYYACTYRTGEVRVQESVDGQIRTLAMERNPAIVSGPGVVLGVITRGSTITCLYGGASVLALDGVAPRSGGIGFQTWSPTAGEAQMNVTDISVTN